MTSSVKASNHNAHPNRLNSWKEIAAYLERDERTVKRWEKSRALPVRRLPGGRGRVFAFCSEIDAWQVGLTHLEDSDPHIPVATPGEEEHLVAAPQEPEAVPEPAHVSAVAAASREPTHVTKSHRWLIAACVLGAFVLTGGAILLRRNHHPPVLAARHNPPSEALNLYLSGRFYWNKRTPADLNLALQDFQSAAAVDPEYAAAYAGIADCYGLSTEFSAMPPQQAFPKMFDAATKAVQLDPDLSEAHRALGFVLFYWNWDRDGARREFDRALQLNPNDATTYHWFGNVLMQSQQAAEGLRLLDRARELDPASPSILADRGLALQTLGRLNDATEVWTSLEHSDSTYLPPHWYLANIHLQQRDIPGYLAEVRQIAEYSQTPDAAAADSAIEAAYRNKGTPGVFDATVSIRQQHMERTQTGYMGVAWALDQANRPQESLHYLELAYEHRDPAFPTIANQGAYLSLDHRPEFLALQAKSREPFPSAKGTAQDSPANPVAALGRGPLGNH